MNPTQVNEAAETVQFSAIIDGVSKKKDSTLSIKLGTQELSADETAKIFEFGNKQIWVGFAETPITKLDVPKEIMEFDGQKSLSERLYNVLRVYWEKSSTKAIPFEQFRANYMERRIQEIKDKLPD